MTLGLPLREVYVGAPTNRAQFSGLVNFGIENQNLAANLPVKGTRGNRFGRPLPV